MRELALQRAKQIITRINKGDLRGLRTSFNWLVRADNKYNFVEIKRELWFIGMLMWGIKNESKSR